MAGSIDLNSLKEQLKLLGHSLPDDQILNILKDMNIEVASQKASEGTTQQQAVAGMGTAVHLSSTTAPAPGLNRTLPVLPEEPESAASPSQTDDDDFHAACAHPGSAPSSFLPTTRLSTQPATASLLQTHTQPQTLHAPAPGKAPHEWYGRLAAGARSAHPTDTGVFADHGDTYDDAQPLRDTWHQDRAAAAQPTVKPAYPSPVYDGDSDEEYQNDLDSNAGPQHPAYTRTRDASGVHTRHHDQDSDTEGEEDCGPYRRVTDPAQRGPSQAAYPGNEVEYVPGRGGVGARTGAAGRPSLLRLVSEHSDPRLGTRPAKFKWDEALRSDPPCAPSRAAMSVNGSVTSGGKPRKTDVVSRYQQLQAGWKNDRFLSSNGGGSQRLSASSSRTAAVASTRKPLNFHSYFKAMHAAAEAEREMNIRLARANNTGPTTSSRTRRS